MVQPTVLGREAGGGVNEIWARAGRDNNCTSLEEYRGTESDEEAQILPVT